MDFLVTPGMDEMMRLASHERVQQRPAEHLYPFIAFLAIEDVDSLRFSSLLNSLSVSPPVILRIAHVRIIALFCWRLVSTSTRFSWASWRLISSTITRA